MILIDSWPYDLMISGELKFSSEITAHPVESGSDVSDHITNDPVELSFESVVSDTPIGAIANHESRRVDFSASETEERLDSVFSGIPKPLPSSEAYERLLAIRNDKRLVTIEIPIMTREGPSKRLFANMGLEDLVIPMGPEQSGGLFFSATFKQVTFVVNERTRVRVAVPAAHGKAQPKATIGQAYRVDKRFNWNWGVPAGAALTANHGWALIDGIWSDGKGAPGAFLIYQYSGEYSLGALGAVGTRQYNVETGRALTDEERRMFLRDYYRDTQDKERARANVLKGAPSYGEDGHGIRRLDKDGNLPPGIDLSRFNETPAQTFPNTWNTDGSQFGQTLPKTIPGR